MKIAIFNNGFHQDLIDEVASCLFGTTGIEVVNLISTDMDNKLPEFDVCVCAGSLWHMSDVNAGKVIPTKKNNLHIYQPCTRAAKLPDAKNYVMILGNKGWPGCDPTVDASEIARKILAYSPERELVGA